MAKGAMVFYPTPIEKKIVQLLATKLEVSESEIVRKAVFMLGSGNSYKEDSILDQMISGKNDLEIVLPKKALAN